MQQVRNTCAGTYANHAHMHMAYAKNMKYICNTYSISMQILRNTHKCTKSMQHIWKRYEPNVKRGPDPGPDPQNGTGSGPGPMVRANLGVWARVGVPFSHVFHIVIIFVAYCSHICACFVWQSMHAIHCITSTLSVPTEYRFKSIGQMITTSISKRCT